MRILPIPFSDPMITALREGRKTQHRVALKLPTKTASGGAIYEHPKMGGWEPTINGGGGCFQFVKGVKVPVPETVGIWHKTCGTCLDAPYQVDDRIYVREAFSFVGSCDPGGLLYRANGYEKECARHGFDEPYPDKSAVKWRPSTNMPKALSRLTLIVTDVQVQRLHGISVDDAVAEGIEDVTREIACRDPSARFWKRYRDGGWNGYVDDPIGSYASLWTEINGAGSWEANPWVTAISFTVHHCNVAKMEPRS